jgi:hypothetical protein
MMRERRERMQADKPISGVANQEMCVVKEPMGERVL